MILEEFISKLQESTPDKEVVFISDGNNCYIAEYDSNLNVIYL